MPHKKTVKEFFDILNDVEPKDSSSTPAVLPNDPDAELTKNLGSHNSRTRSEHGNTTTDIKPIR